VNLQCQISQSESQCSSARELFEEQCKSEKDLLKKFKNDFKHLVKQNQIRFPPTISFDEFNAQLMKYDTYSQINDSHVRHLLHEYYVYKVMEK
jgi:hypothetical protein